MQFLNIQWEPFHGSAPEFMEPGDRYPYHIDPARVGEARDTEPVDPWNWGHFEEQWFPLIQKSIRDERTELLGQRKEWGIHFRNKRHFNSWLEGEIEKMLDVKLKCSECDFETKNSDALTRHEGTNSCRIRKLKMEARENKKVYVPPHKAKHYCDACNTDYANRHAFIRHLNSETHRQTTNPDPLPTKCLVCNIPFETPLKTKRHLKSSKKCHRKALADEDLLTQYFYMFDRFRCKFDRKLIYHSAKCIPCPPKNPVQTAPKVLVV